MTETKYAVGFEAGFDTKDDALERQEDLASDAFIHPPVWSYEVCECMEPEYVTYAHCACGGKIDW